MSKAEEAALKAYPSDIYSGGKSCRRAYKEGYEQAEKGLRITPGDILLIDELLREVSNSIAVGDLPEMNRQAFYLEVLNRYNNIKMKIDKL